MPRYTVAAFTRSGITEYLVIDTNGSFGSLTVGVIAVCASQSAAENIAASLNA